MTSAQFIGLIPYLVSLLISIILLIYSWRFRRSSGAGSFIVMLCGHILWTSGYVAELISTTLAAKQFADDYQFIGAWLVPLAFLIMSIEYIRNHPISNLWWLLIALVVLVFSSILFLSPLDGLVRYDARLLPGGLFGVYLYRFGPLGWFYIAVSYGAALAAIVILVRALLLGSPAMRAQLGLILTGGLIPFFGNIVSMSGMTVQRDIAPLTYALMYLPVTYALFRRHFLDLLPIAREIVLDNLEEQVFVTDFDGRIVDMNRSARERAPLPLENMIGRHPHELYPEARSQIELLLAQREFKAELDFVHESGKSTFATHLKTIYGESANPRGRLLVLRDITDQKAREVEREQMIEDLNAFAEIVAHDLKNPLNSIINYIDLLSEPTLSDAKRQDLAERAMVGAERLSLMIDELLLLSRLRADQIIPLRPIDMGQVISEALDRVSAQIQATQARIELPDHWPLVNSHAPWLVEAWANLISNAIKYGGTPPQVRLAFAPEPGAEIRFMVCDNGPGIAPADQQRVFTRYERLGRADERGYGLGLNIVQRIVERLGGHVGVQSTPGQGSCFYFTLPAPFPEED